MFTGSIYRAIYSGSAFGAFSSSVLWLLTECQTAQSFCSSVVQPVVLSAVGGMGTPPVTSLDLAIHGRVKSSCLAWLFISGEFCRILWVRGFLFWSEFSVSLDAAGFLPRSSAAGLSERTACVSVTSCGETVDPPDSLGSAFAGAAQRQACFQTRDCWICVCSLAVCSLV